MTILLQKQRKALETPKNELPKNCFFLVSSYY